MSMNEEMGRVWTEAVVTFILTSSVKSPNTSLPGVWAENPTRHERSVKINRTEIL
jgi:hypothetical protein